jgi:hypothetical protein
VTLTKTLIQLLEPVQELERGPQGAFGVVLVRRRDAEDGDDRIADVLLDRPTPRGDDLGERLEADTQERVQPLGIEPLTELRRADQVGEQDRRELALGSRNRPRLSGNGRRFWFAKRLTALDVE